MPPNKRPSFMSLAVYVLVVGAAVFLAVSNAVQTWPTNAVGYIVGASNPLPTIQARYFPGTQPTSIIGRPTLAPDFLNRVLAAAHSPAQGTGQALYDLSIQFGIDDAYALAFFKHESQYGTTGMAQVTSSLGNIRCSAGYRCISGYRAYATWEAGYADWYALILTLYVKQWHLTTPAQIIPVYAPASDQNDPAAYLADVEQSVATWRHGEVQV